jgi:hypothetical protein
MYGTPYRPGKIECSYDMAGWTRKETGRSIAGAGKPNSLPAVVPGARLRHIQMRFATPYLQ